MTRLRGIRGRRGIAARAVLVAGGTIMALAAAVGAAPATRASASPVLHAALLSSEPAAGARLVASPARIRLVFSEPIEASLAAVSLSNANGERFVLGPAADPRDVHAVIALAPPLGAGTYTAVWRVVSADGHRVDGSFGFTVESGAGASTAPSVLTTEPQQVRGTPGAAGDDTSFVQALGRRRAVPVLRSLAITALLALAGLTLLIATLPISGPRPLRLALFLAVASTVLLAAYAVSWSTNSTGDGASGVLDSLSLTASTTPGALEVARVALAFLALWSIALARRPGLAALFSGAAVLITGASGHPAVIAPMFAIPAKSIHLAAAAVWMGGLLWIVTAERHGARYVEGTRRISSLAFISVIVVLATGILQTVLFLPRVSALNGSIYGQLVLFKLAGLLVLVLFGVFHRRAIPRLDTTMARRRLRGSVRFEIVVMLAVGILGGLLAAIAPPR